MRNRIWTAGIVLALFAGVMMLGYAGCGGGGGGSDSGSSAPDTTPPTVSSKGPAANATGIAFNTVITVTFSEAMSATTVTTGTFTLSGVAGTVICVGAAATFTPSAALADLTVYTATITTGVTDSAGNALAVDYTWSFTTGQAWRTPVLVETDNAGDAGGPQIAVDANGNALAVWRRDGTTANIWANRYVSGTGWATAGPIETGTVYANSPQIAVDASGNAFVVWEQSDGTRYNIWSNRYVEHVQKHFYRTALSGKQ
ncbi:MAG: Ig-like domain-containing protein [Planctomycetes bacterium]|nr:Ig-like domain-containing protein [Planctomycetota bacterium]